MSGYSQQVGQIPGTGTNDSAAAGNVGQILSATGTLSSVTNATSINGTSISLTPGDWDVTGVAIAAANNATTNLTSMTGSLSIVSAAHSFVSGDFVAQQYGAGIVPGSGNAIEITLPTKQFTVPAGTTVTVFAVVSSNFSISTNQMNAFIRARRVR